MNPGDLVKVFGAHGVLVFSAGDGPVKTGHMPTNVHAVFMGLDESRSSDGVFARAKVYWSGELWHVYKSDIEEIGVGECSQQ